MLSRSLSPFIDQMIELLIGVCVCLEFLVFFAKPFNSAGRIHKFLLTGEKRMARRADFHRNVLRGGTGLNHVAARTSNIRVTIFWMNVFLHCNEFPPIWLFEPFFK